MEPGTTYEDTLARSFDTFNIKKHVLGHNFNIYPKEFLLVHLFLKIHQKASVVRVATIIVTKNITSTLQGKVEK